MIRIYVEFMSGLQEFLKITIPELLLVFIGVTASDNRSEIGRKCFINGKRVFI
ncbi:MAG: hypothetical protein RSB82_04395 [Victivallaceae bacterium]